MHKNDIGVIGMAVMGKNLALNIANHGYNVAVFNRTKAKTKDIINHYSGNSIFPYFNIQDFLKSLITPRCILLMVQSGKSIDNVIESMLPYLNTGDIIIDGGNSFYKDTLKRNLELLKKNIYFIGAGISGGEYGALTGPAIMPGGDKKAYQMISPILTAISAKYNNEPCVDYIGPDGSGHYVKMIHNGIEYADMQLISEAYFILKHVLNLQNYEISKILDIWNQGELNSYLINITKNILNKKDQDDDLIELILDEANNKGTGKWACQESFNLNEPLTVITTSVFARYLSSLKSQRTLASKILSGPKLHNIIHNKDDFIENIRRSLYLSKIISYAQGFSQLGAASKKYFWNLKFSNIAKIFRSGCIIQAKCLDKIVDAYKYDDIIINLLFSPYFQEISNEYHNDLRKMVSYSILNGIAIPAFSAAITYYDNYRTKKSSANLIQAQRDYFGAHTYKRIDKEGFYHTQWC